MSDVETKFEASAHFAECGCKYMPVKYPTQPFHYQEWFQELQTVVGRYLFAWIVIYYGLKDYKTMKMIVGGMTIPILAVCIERVWWKLPRSSNFYYGKAACNDCSKKDRFHLLCYHCMKIRCPSCVNLHMHNHDLQGMDQGCMICNHHCREQSVVYSFMVSPDGTSYPLHCHFQNRRHEPKCLLNEVELTDPRVGANTWKWPWQMTFHDWVRVLELVFFLIRLLCYLLALTGVLNEKNYS